VGTEDDMSVTAPPLTPTVSGTASAGAVVAGGSARGVGDKVDVDGVLNAFDNALDDWFGGEQGMPNMMLFACVCLYLCLCTCMYVLKGC